MPITRYDTRASLDSALVKAKERFIAARELQADMPMYVDLYKEGRPYLTIFALPDKGGSIRRVITMISSALHPDAESRVMDSYGLTESLDRDNDSLEQAQSLVKDRSLAQRFADGDPRVTEMLMVTFGASHGSVSSLQLPYVRGYGSKTMFREPEYMDDVKGRVPREIDTSLGGMERDENAPYPDIRASDIVLALPGSDIMPNNFIMTLHQHSDWSQAHDFEGWRRFNGGWISQESQWDNNLMIAPMPVLE